jgi:hypothetical protein
MRPHWRVRIGIEAARYAHQGAAIRQSLHVLPWQPEPSQVTWPCDAEAPPRFECFSFQDIVHGLAAFQLLGI